MTDDIPHGLRGKDSHGPYELIDSEQKHRDHPKTWESPSTEEIDAVKVGNFVKIGLQRPDGSGERFWVEITSINAEQSHGYFWGRLDNDLHGYDILYLSVMGFERKHVMAIIV